MQKESQKMRRRVILITCLVLLTWVRGPSFGLRAEPLAVCATTPDLGNLVEVVGGDEVSVTVFSKGPQDPHFIEAKPSFIKSLHRADLFIQSGLGLESGWAPVLLRSARNPRTVAGASGHLDTSTVVPKIFDATGALDRVMGDVHPEGNPHYLADPLNGLLAANLIRKRLGELRPAKKKDFEKRYLAFRRRLAESLFGAKLLAAYDETDIPKLLKLLRLKGLPAVLAYLDGQDQRALLGGWLGSMAPHVGARVVSDHNIWPYFSERFAVEVIATLEPKPGIAPTTRHLRQLIDRMRAENVKIILAAPYFDVRHARFVASKTAGKIVNMAHQSGALSGTSTYIQMMDHNVRVLSEALTEFGAKS